MARTVLIWAALAAAIVLPLAAAALSPYLQWRDPVYIAAGFAGIGAMALLLLQPLLAAGLLPGLPLPRARRIHRFVGIALVAAVVAHVAGLWITSPPDMIDALTLTAPTPFSYLGVIAMWAVFAAACLAALRRRLGPQLFRTAHTLLALVIVLASTAHALLIEGAMETVTKTALCALAVAATAWAVTALRARRAPTR